MLNVKVYRDSDLWIGALPVNERNFRGEKDKDVYGLLQGMGICDTTKGGKRGDDYFRVSPKEIAIPITPPTVNRQNAPDQAWLNVGQTVSGSWSRDTNEYLLFEELKRRREAVDHGQHGWLEKRRKQSEPSALTKERGPEYLLWGHESLDFSSHTKLPTADFIDRVGDGLMDGGDHEAYFLRTRYAPFPGGALVQVSDHEFFQEPALIAVVMKKRKGTLKERLMGRANILPEQLLTPNTVILERYRYIEECRRHPIVKRHVADLEEFFPESVKLEIFTNRDYPAIVKKLGSDFNFAYKLKVVGEVRVVPEIDGRKLEGLFSPSTLGSLLESHRATLHSRAVWLTKDFERKVFNGPTAWLERAPKGRKAEDSSKPVVRVA